MEKRTTFLGHSEQGIFAQGLFTGLEKTAAPDVTWETAEEIRKYIRTITPEDKKRYCYVLVNALGAGEFFGSNINADYFPWNALCHEGDDFGYKTFLRAHAYTHHVNKDPTKSIGIPVVSVLNPRMKRVELIIRLDREKAKLEGADGVVTRIDNGEFPDVSMGCKVPFDVCSICGNQSKTKDDYCHHMRPPPEMRGIWGPNKILSDGRKIYVINTVPRFFDISFVFIGADKTAKVMAKLASKGSHVCLGSVCALPGGAGEEGPALYGPTGDALSTGSLRKTASACGGGRTGPCGRRCSECSEQQSCEGEKLASAFGVKVAAHRKAAEIVKSIPSGVFSMKKLPQLEREEPDLDDDILDDLAECPLPQVLGATSSLGMVLKPREFQRIILLRMGNRDVADGLDQHHHVFRPVHRFDDSRMDFGDLAHDLLPLLLPHLLARRTAFGPHFALRAARVHGEAKKTLPTREPVAHPLLDKVSAAYNGYRRNMMMKLSQIREEVLDDPRLRAAVLGDGLSNMFLKTAHPSEPITRDSVAYFMGAHLSDRAILNTTAVASATAVLNQWLGDEPSA